MFQIAVEIQEETEREARDLVKREQDLAFELAQQVYIFKKMCESKSLIL